MKNLKYRFLSLRLQPGGLIYIVLFQLVRMLFNVGLLKHRPRFDYIIEDEFVFVLTPLSGSSSIRRRCKERVKRRFQMRDKIYFLCREDSLRMQSFYNKKVRNPDEVGKCILLAMCPPLVHDSTVEDFISTISQLQLKNKDKHLFRNPEILHYLDIEDNAIELNINTDKKQIEQLLGLELGIRENSSKERSSFQGVVKFDSDQLQKIDRAAIL